MSDITSPQEVIERLCALVTEVGSRQCAELASHDCFCGVNPLGKSDFRVDEYVIEFIETAVRDRLSNIALAAKG